jgi:hypothetical protein
MDLSQIKLPGWLMPATKNLMDLAEELFGPGTGAAKKAWVRSALLHAAESVDLPNIPNWIENPAKAALIDFLIEVVWGLHFRGPNLGRRIRPGRALHV